MSETAPNDQLNRWAEHDMNAQIPILLGTSLGILVLSQVGHSNRGVER